MSRGLSQLKNLFSRSFAEERGRKKKRKGRQMGDLYSEERQPACWWDRTGASELLQKVGVNCMGFVEAASVAIAEGAIRGSGQLSRYEFDRPVKPAFTAAIDKYLKENLRAHVISEQIGQDGEVVRRAYVWPRGAIWMTNVVRDDYPEPLNDGEKDSEPVVFVERPIPLTGEVVGSDHEEVAGVSRLITEFKPDRVVIPHEHPGYAYVLANIPMRGLEIIPLGLSGIELERGNYSSDVLAGFDRAVADLNTKSPRGRLVILEGPPGTGKTYLVRAFMKSAPESKFVIIPPHLIESLADPGIILTFMRELIHGSTGPLVIVLEDADACLSERKAESMNSIAAVLNLSDGIVGSLLDLRVLATTNTNMKEFDAALLRPGRLSAHMKAGDLAVEQVMDVWKRLTGQEYPSPHAVSPMTIARIYAKYNELSDVEKSLAEVRRQV